MTDVTNCKWAIPEERELHYTEFSHGSKSGKRTLSVNGKAVSTRERSRQGENESFKIGELRATVVVFKKPTGGFQYSLRINDDPFTKYREPLNRRFSRWEPEVHGNKHMVVFDHKDANLYVDGRLRTCHSEIINDHVVTTFRIENVGCELVALGGPNGVCHQFTINNFPVPLIVDEDEGIFHSK